MHSCLLTRLHRRTNKCTYEYTCKQTYIHTESFIVGVISVCGYWCMFNAFIASIKSVNYIVLWRKDDNETAIKSNNNNNNNSVSYNSCSNKNVTITCTIKSACTTITTMRIMRTLVAHAHNSKWWLFNVSISRFQLFTDIQTNIALVSQVCCCCCFYCFLLFAFAQFLRRFCHFAIHNAN